ncbi:hypothetical protein [Oceanobacillus sp. Castelsardo]|uniref:hypothetical protein n=1 Tax=Oceanobacillus sp. Castelsardo TaxID=1851204 RepID=UPI001E4C0EAF|nr:hypothetical protein [Oceanobacillus sp. Castelsardo]
MLNSRYALYFNKRHRLVGHVFQGRYGAEIIETVDYQLEVSRYIHLNPLEAEMVSKPEDYPWSSYSAYILGIQNSHVTTGKILGYFKNSKRDKYRRFVEGR